MSTAAVVLDVMIASMARPREPTQSSRQSNTNVGTDPDNPLAAVLHGRPGHQRRHIVIVYQTPPQLQSFVLLVARRVAGDTLEDQSPVSLPFRTAERDARGGDLVYSVIEGRVVLEKKTRIRYQIEKLVRIAGGVSKNAANGKRTHSFSLMPGSTDSAVVYTRPLTRPSNLVNNDQARTRRQTVNGGV